MRHPLFDILQCIGLKDKHGKEIYEKDIVVQSPPNIAFGSKPVIVEWDNDFAMFLIGKRSLPHIDEKDIEIIGNIYENPELVRKDHAIESA